MGSNIQTPGGLGKVIKNNIIEQTVLVRLEDESILTYSMEELSQSHKTTLKLINYSTDQEPPKKYLHRNEYSFIKATFKLPPKNQTQQPTSLT